MKRPITMNDYQREARTTAQYPAEHPASGLLYTALGLAGEAGEVANQAKKVLRDDGGRLTPLRREVLAAELGDVLWYAAMLAHELNIPLGTVAKANLAKLLRRKAEGTVKGDGDHR